MREARESGRPRELVVVNASGHEVRMPSLASYHGTRAAEAARLAVELGSDFAADLAVEHATEAARAALEGRA